MSLQTYSLGRGAFNITSNPDIFFESASHKEALMTLLYGINERKGIILISGEVGTGKTTLCKALLNRLPSQVRTSLIINPYFSEVQLLEAIVKDFGLMVTRRSRLDIINELNSFLVKIGASGGNAVLIIDEAQTLTRRQLEQIRLLSNLETSWQKLLQIVIVGQPEIEKKLRRFDMRQLRQRIFVKYKIAPLGENEVRDYVEFRLKQAYEASVNISLGSYKLIYSFSQGIPRLINMLCDRVLLLGFVKEKLSFGEEDFRACIEELQ